jgi:hypothetical protein
MVTGAERVQVRTWLVWLGLGLLACGGRTLDDGVYGVDGAGNTTSCSYDGKSYSDGSLVAGACVCFCNSGQIECEQDCTTPSGGASNAGASGSGTAGSIVFGGSSSGGASSGGTFSTAGAAGSSTGGFATGGSLSTGATGGIATAGSTAAGGSSVGGSGGAPTVVCGGAPRQANGMQPLIDNMEDQDRFIDAVEGRSGSWFTYNDNTGGVQAPSPVANDFFMESVSSDASGGHFVAETYGAGFSSWGAGMGFVLSNGCPYNAKIYQGIHFYVRTDNAPTPLYVMLPTAATTPLNYGGTCDTNLGQTCYDDYQSLVSATPSWNEVYLSYGSLMQQGWGTRVGFDPTTLIGVNFQTLVGGGESFSFAVDDISFF